MESNQHTTTQLEAHSSPWHGRGKRLFDVALGSLIFVVALPILLIVSVLIKLSDGGSVFFFQDRAGRDGKIFQPWKFRTMRAGRKPDPKELVPLHHAEITFIGKFLRRFKIDELPQIINVLQGDMSLVGPRPTLPDQVAAYDEFRRLRLLVKPGLTGLAQVYSSAEASWEERILYDVAYVQSASFALDLHILLRTGLVILLGEARTSQPFLKSRFACVVTPPIGYFKAEDPAS